MQIIKIFDIDGGYIETKLSPNKIVKMNLLLDNIILTKMILENQSRSAEEHELNTMQTIKIFDLNGCFIETELSADNILINLPDGMQKFGIRHL